MDAVQHIGNGAVESESSRKKKAEYRAQMATLRLEINAVKEEVSSLKEQVLLMEAQNLAKLEKVRLQQDSLATIFKRDSHADTQYLKKFPIPTREDLVALERLIDKSILTKAAMVNTVRSLLFPGGVVKRIKKVLSMELCMAYNVNGACHKQRLLDHPTFLSVLYLASMHENLTNRQFLLELKTGLKRAKQVYTSRHYLRRKATRNSKAKACSDDE